MGGELHIAQALGGEIRVSDPHHYAKMWIRINADLDPDPNPKPWVRYHTGERQADESEIEEKCSPKEDCRQGELSCGRISGNAGR